MSHEREIAEEQEFLDVALSALDHMRQGARELRDSAAVANMRGAGDLVERDVVMGTALHRLDQLAIGDQSLFFGRIDYQANGHGEGDTYHVGRLAVSDEALNPLVIDWRAPVAEAFYRATGVEPLGLSRRRHVAIRANEVTSVEDEYFADANGDIDLPESEARAATEEGLVDGGLALGGPGALLAALGRARTGRMGDIIATIQGEQDQIIRSPLAGILLVQGGPGTGKTAVALHRAAYLLFTHRATLERQGVLVVGPNPLFLNYIENVLPSLGESGVTLSTIAGLVTNVDVRAPESEEVDQLKGDIRMVRVLAKALRTRERPLRQDVEIPVGRAILTLKASYTAETVERARRRPGNHNQRRSAVGRELAARLANEYESRFVREVSDEVNGAAELADLIRNTPQFKDALQRIWPRISGQELLHDLLGAPALLRAAGKGILSDHEIELLYRPRFTSLEDIAWTKADAALIDEARVLVGPRRRPRPAPKPTDNVLDGVDLDAYAGNHRAAALREAQRLAVAQSQELDEAEFVTYGHIVVDEAQDLSPMELRVLKRRDLTGSMTIVGDMGQATTASSSASWDALLEVLAPRRAPARVDLTVSYRTPEEVLNFAARTLLAAAPDLEPPRPVRRAGAQPTISIVSEAEFAESLVKLTRREIDDVAPGRVAVIVTSARVDEVVTTLRDGGLEAVDPRDQESKGLSADLVVLSAEGANGLEFDAVVVVEPGQIANRGSDNPTGVTPRGLRTLYVALTRPTRRLAVIASHELPDTLR
ncbi:MAG TPA: UvrD-helicase domain-containing protein [Acidimicrobiales bacterium]|jgi:DNA helicase IV|nr:UvrD-helicase domain-containing protein [Acidimicrobiales bacterium]